MVKFSISKAAFRINLSQHWIWIIDQSMRINRLDYAAVWNEIICINDRPALDLMSHNLSC